MPTVLLLQNILKLRRTNDMKEKIKSIITNLGYAFSSVLQKIQADAELKKQEKQLQMELLDKQMLLSRCNQHFMDIPNELFYVMGYRHYPYLQTLTAPTDFVPATFNPTPQGTLYYYNLVSTQAPARIQLQQLKEKINHDIYMAQQQLLLQMPYQNACVLYPHIMQGLYIMDIVSNGMFLHFKIASNYF